VSKLLDPKKYDIELKSPEKPEEIQSRLKREEAKEAHERQISLIVHIFVMAIVAVSFLASVYIAVAGDPKTGLPDKAMGIITAIVAAGVGYMTGKGSKIGFPVAIGPKAKDEAARAYSAAILAARR
jgi:hypothetical protein